MTSESTQNGSRRHPVSERRQYRVLTTGDAKEIASAEVESFGQADDVVNFGLPEIDDQVYETRQGPAGREAAEAVELHKGG